VIEICYSIWLTYAVIQFHTGPEKPATAVFLCCHQYCWVRTGHCRFLFISVYILDQHAYDRWIDHADRIYRLEKGPWAATGTAYGPYMAREFPEVEKMARVSPGSRNTLLQYGETSFPGNKIMYADSTIFDIISFSFIEGNPHTALNDPHSIVLTESLAEAIFGTRQDVLGRVLRFADMMPLRVTGLIRDIHHFHMPANGIVPFHLLVDIFPGDENFLYEWGSWNYATFVMLAPGTNIPQLEEKMNEAFYEETLAVFGSATEKDFFLRPLKDIYFANDIKHEMPVMHGSRQTVRLFLAIALFILLIAIVNFVNLSTARSSLRSREVGIRRLLGSRRSSLVLQFLTESVVITALAVMLALVVLEIGLPWFNRFANTSFHISDMKFFAIIGLMASSSLIVGVFSGIYPSLYLTSFVPVDVLKGDATHGKKGAFFRKTLIIFQFVISISLIIATLVIQGQLKYMQEKDSGLGLKNTLVIHLNQHIFPRWDAFKQGLSEHPGIKEAALSAQLPGSITWQESADVNDLDDQQYTLMPVSTDYPKMVGMQVLAGRLFTKEYASEVGRAVIMNEQAVQYFGYDGPYEQIVGQAFGNQFRIVGIVRDFHYNSMHNPIGPLVILWEERRLNFALIKIDSQYATSAIKHIEDLWYEFSPSIPFEYSYLDSIYLSNYDQDEQLGQLFMIFSAFAILIACLGLFGLASFMAERRMREMAIRKVMGAGMNTLVMLLLKDYVKMIFLSFLLAAPISWYMLHEYLNSFPYRISMTVLPFLIALIAALLITVITVSYHAIRVSHVNPGLVLKYE
jgi:putative ABC transport system permease protein